MKSHFWGHFSNQWQLCWKQKCTGLKVSRLWAVTLNKSLSLSDVSWLKYKRTGLDYNFALKSYSSNSIWFSEMGLASSLDHEVHGNVGWGCWQALPRAAKARLIGDSMWPGAWEPPTSEHLRLGDPGQFTRPLVFPLWQREENNLPYWVALRS